MPKFKDNAICLRDLDYSESSQIVVLLTAEHGKLRGIAKGSRRQSPSSIQRFSGGLFLLNCGQVMATTRPHQELASITEWDLQDDCFGLRRHLGAQRAAMIAADLLNALLPDGDPHPKAFVLMTELLKQLTTIIFEAEAGEDTAMVASALLVFQWGLLCECGYQPELNRDVRLNEPLDKSNAYSFDPTAGGLTTQRRGGDWRVRSATVALLQRLAAGEEVAAEGEGLERANRLLCVYARAILDKELPTMRLLLEGKGRCVFG
ncbi:MAG: DNA repair protein RecO [Algisphaera sp.]